MKNLNNVVQLIGHLGKEVEVFDVSNGKKLAKVSLATNDSYTNKSGEKVDQTEWHNLVAWGRTAELLEQLTKKGSQLMVTGKLTNRSYEDKQGIKRYTTEILVDQFQLLKNGAEKTPF